MHILDLTPRALTGADGMIEGANRTIAKMLTAFVDKNLRDWDEHIPMPMMAYRSAVHESTGISPHKMMFGRHITIPLDLTLGRVDLITQYTYKSEYAYKLALNLAKIHEHARQQLHISSQNMMRPGNSIQNYTKTSINLVILSGYLSLKVATRENLTVHGLDLIESIRKLMMFFTRSRKAPKHAQKQFITII